MTRPWLFKVKTSFLHPNQLESLRFCSMVVVWYFTCHGLLFVHLICYYWSLYTDLIRVHSESPLCNLTDF